MRAHRHEPVCVVLSASRRVRGRPAGKEAHRRAVYEHAVLWVPEDDGMPAEAGPGHQPQAGNEADAGDGDTGDLPEAQAEHIGQWAQDLPVSFRGLTHRPA